ncbi:prepilin-type N-terminal cleavage/methylation domain-containing protein [bacterium]|nr:prepilin-type N-terminal cleavage/methylation domain-containing protein [bacterium]
MKIKLNLGFTLTETLLTLSILGVLAALIIPELVLNVDRNKSGAMLGKSALFISSGCEALVQHANDNSTTGSYFEGFDTIRQDDLVNNNNNTLLINNANLFEVGQSFWGLSPMNNAYTMRAFDGQNSNVLNNSRTMFNEKLGIYLGILNDTYNEGGELDPIRKLIFVDTNGGNMPNRFGADIFLFGLTNRCQLIPAGTARVEDIFANAGTQADDCNGNNITNGLACTSRVVDNKFKIDY